MTQVTNGKLRGRMAEYGFTIRSLSERTGIPIATLSDKINGKSEFKASEIATIAKVLDIENVRPYFF